MFIGLTQNEDAINNNNSAKRVTFQHPDANSITTGGSDVSKKHIINQNIVASTGDHPFHHHNDHHDDDPHLTDVERALRRRQTQLQRQRSVMVDHILAYSEHTPFHRTIKRGLRNGSRLYFCVKPLFACKT